MSIQKSNKVKEITYTTFPLTQITFRTYPKRGSCNYQKIRKYPYTEPKYLFNF